MVDQHRTSQGIYDKGTRKGNIKPEKKQLTSRIESKSFEIMVG